MTAALCRPGRPTKHRLQRSAVVAALACTASLLVTAAVASPSHLPAAPKSPHETAAIEGFAPDQSQFFCRSTVEPGVKAFERVALSTYPASRSDGDMRGCLVGGTSEHKDGRAFDWGVDHRIAKQRADGQSMLRWLFATDQYGNNDAMFRRLGLMYIIWNKQIWGSWSQRWEPYSCSGPTLCHVNHMHFSFGWAGAEKKTSYWTGTVSGVVEPALPILARLHVARILRLSAHRGSTTALWLLKGNATYRVLAAGRWRHGKVQGDAVCTKTSQGWVPSIGDGLRLGGDQLQGWGQQWLPTKNNGSGYNPTTHTYRLVVHELLPSTVTAQLTGKASGGTGGLRLRFTRTA
jgi:hypothetical protein